MTKTMFATLIAATMAVACSEDEDPKSSSPTTEQTKSGLSASFQSTCARCHGDEGRGKDTFPSIPGSRDEASFIAIVRSGQGDMPANAAATISDEELRADYLWLTTKRE
jgi:mono/diheme cytochrome c family protein